MRKNFIKFLSERGPKNLALTVFSNRKNGENGAKL
jgi:hypothetical protein